MSRQIKCRTPESRGTECPTWREESVSTMPDQQIASGGSESAAITLHQIGYGKFSRIQYGGSQSAARAYGPPPQEHAQPSAELFFLQRGSKNSPTFLPLLLILSGDIE